MSLNNFNLTEVERDAYLRYRLAQEADDLMINKTFSEGIEKGEKIGIEKEKKETAHKMMLKGLPLDIISEITELSKSEIEKLKDL